MPARPSPIQLSIPHPCHESWEAMTPTAAGRHCASCDKVVMDFTRMTDGELAAWFAARAGQQTCGRMRRDQLARPLLPVARPVPAGWRWVLATLAVLGGRSWAAAQTPPKAAIQVVDVRTGEPIAGARVIIHDGRKKAWSALTDETGCVWKSAARWWKVDVVHPDYFVTQGRAVAPYEPKWAGETLRRIALQPTQAEVAVWRTPIIDDISGVVSTLDVEVISPPKAILPKRILHETGGFFRRLFSRQPKNSVE